uniref:Protein TsetseEP domain-containing protein n=1 Tax=Anopheles farauti TaxID=69004 RepID=A0A182Q1U8_9DIPT
MSSKRNSALLLLCFFCWFERGCSDDNHHPQEAKGQTSPTASDTSFYVTTDFILQLNELIKHLALYTLDESVGTREAVENAGHMWNRTDLILEDLAKRSENIPTRDSQDRKSNVTDFSLRDALEAIRSVKSNFLAQTSDPMEIDAVAFIGPYVKSGTVGSTVDSTVMQIMHTSVDELTNVSAKLLGTLERVESRKIKTAGHARNVNQVQPSIAMFLEGFRRTIVDTERNFQTQANGTVKRIRSRLSTLDQNQQLGEYSSSAVGRMKMFTTDVTTHLDMTYTNVETSMVNWRTVIETSLSNGITDLLTQAGTNPGSGFLHRCMKRFVFTYYDQSLAVAKLLYCGEPEKTTLQYLVTVAIPVLERAAITATSVTQMEIVCSIGSTACMDNFYNMLPNLYATFDSLILSYTEFIHQELAALTQRVDICASSAALDVEKFVQDMNTRFNTCIRTGSVN